MDLTSLVSGPIGLITGLLGGAMEGYKKYKLEQLALTRLDMEQVHEKGMFSEEAKHASAMKVIDTETKVNLADLNNLATSINSDKATYSKNFTAKFVKLAEEKDARGFYALFILSLLILVDVIKGFIRPGITITLLWFNHSLARVKVLEDGFALNPAANAEVFLASTAVGWWFGSRGVQLVSKSMQK